MPNDSRQLVYVEIDEEITSVYGRIKNLIKKEIYLVVPKKAILFQSVVNLKILKDKMLKRDKKLIIVTTDRNGRHLAGKAGIECFNRIEVEKGEVPQIEESPIVKIQPIQARKNMSPREENPTRFTEKKISIRDLIEEYRKKNKKEKSHSSDSHVSFHLIRPSRKFLTLIVAVSIGLFMLIGYIALPSVTVYIKPKFDNITYTVNITLADKRKNQLLLSQNKPHVIASEIIDTTTKQTKVFDTTGKEFKGVNAKGKVKFTNMSDEDWELKGGTRLMTSDGLIFRIPYGVVVPARTLDTAGVPIPGTIQSQVEADPLDLYGKPIGERGNVPAGKFTLPGLSKYNQRLIWAQSDAPMSGGITNYDSVVTKEDIESAKKQMQDNLILMAKEDLKTYIDEVNRLNNTKLILMDDTRYLKTKLEDLRISDDLEGSHKEKFELFAKISAKGVAFDFEQLFTILKTELSSRTHPEMSLKEDSIVPENITYDVIEQDDGLGHIKITATVAGIEEYAIDDDTEAGSKFANKVKEKILGLSMDEARNIIGNFPEVDAVEIKPWPMWVTSIPHIPESIDIKLMGN